MYGEVAVFLSFPFLQAFGMLLRFPVLSVLPDLVNPMIYM